MDACIFWKHSVVTNITQLYISILVSTITIACMRASKVISMRVCAYAGGHIDMLPLLSHFSFKLFKATPQVKDSLSCLSLNVSLDG